MSQQRAIQAGFSATFTNLADLDNLTDFGDLGASSTGTFSADTMWEGHANELLHNEKCAIKLALLGRWKSTEPSSRVRDKSAEDSTLIRKYGNEIYNAKTKDKNAYLEALNAYSQSIAFAPNDSSELAYGYGNRSALLFRLEEYADCIKDCDRAMKITSCDILKYKLTCRKAECLAFLDKDSAKKVCDDALQKLCTLSIKENLRKQFVGKFQNILKSLKQTKSPNQINKPEDWPELTDLKYQKEAPYASNSVKINYRKEWGRHITATKDIKPGEIIAIPNNFCSLILEPGMYIYCSNCVQPTWSSIPCKSCSFDAYCSEKCMSEAWIKYHQYECPVYPFIWYNGQKPKNSFHAIRILLLMIHSAGGIEQLKKALNDVELSKDLRTKGFSSDGIFHSDHFSSMYSNMCGPDYYIQFSRIHEATLNLRLIATLTDLLGKPEDMTVTNDNAIFFGALLIRIDTHLDKLLLVHTHEFGKVKAQCTLSFNAFNSLFNHSCNPNTELLPVKGNKTVIYAKHPIKKGEQLFVSYRGMRYLWQTKEGRQKHLKETFGFTCECLACTEDWSNICVPRPKEMFFFTPPLMVEFRKAFEGTGFTKLFESDFEYSLESIKTIKLSLEKFSTLMTVHMSDYIHYERELMEMFIKYFGSWAFDLSHKRIYA